ncbi:MAG: FUSC family protein [Acetobacter sp.]|nr:FUSC family protein [Acetobacter sp.]MCH4062098.1 FUSC family protein [Acetobacter sp.]MCH4089055.1 FUSC family protein [Acetobacter sp.]MCI1293221.1 FUSC family protein [Acetobacter sp.]MCI1320156.1 FUSC family protein [Acetobacter sp.]
MPQSNILRLFTYFLSGIHPEELWKRALGWLGRPFSLGKFNCFVAPDLVRLGYAMRTTFSSLVALGIALWWELDSPQWACLTVWMIAQGSRGKSLGKAPWHLFGMVVGTISAVALAAAFPQQPMLFILGLAGLIGLFNFCATLMPGPASMTNYRMHGMRATGFTLSIISIEAIADPNHVFDVAMARATYITLGILLETVISSLFQFGLDVRARAGLRTNIAASIAAAAALIADLLREQAEPHKRTPEFLRGLVTTADQIEFTQKEMDRDHFVLGEHARAALAGTMLALTRARDLAVIISPSREAQPSAAARAQALLAELPDALQSPDRLTELLARFRDAEVAWRVDIAQVLTSEMQVLAENGPLALTDRLSSRDVEVLHGFRGIFVELSRALEHYAALLTTAGSALRWDRFRFAICTYRDWRLAGANGIRAFVPVLLAGVFWIATAWPSGDGFLMFVGVMCSLFPTLDRPATITNMLMHGTMFASIISMIMAFWVIPTLSPYEMLAAALTVPFVFGGLAMTSPALIIGGVAFNLFLPILIMPSNQGRLEEVTFFNTALPLILAMSFSVWMYRLVLPTRPDLVCRVLRRDVLRDIHRYALRAYSTPALDIVGIGVSRMIRLLNVVASHNDGVIDVTLRGMLSSTSLLLGLERLHAVMTAEALPPRLLQVLALVNARVAGFTRKGGAHYGRTVRTVALAIRMFNVHEIKEFNLSRRIEILSTLATLRMMHDELSKNRAFLDFGVPKGEVA